MGGGGKGKSKYQVAEYYLTVDYGLGHGPLDSVDEIWVKDKLIWSGSITQNTSLTLNQPEAFGGRKKEGGVYGRVDCYLGTLDQVMTGPSAVRYGRTVAEMPGYQGIAHFLFRGPEEGEITASNNTNGIFGLLSSSIWGLLAPAQSRQSGFLWGSNNPYLAATWITATRNPKGWRDDIASIPRDGVGDRSIFILLDRSASLTGSQFTNIKNSILQSLRVVELSISLGNRVDLAVRFWSTGSGDLMIQKPNATLSDVDEVRDFIAAAGQLTGGNIVPSYEAARDWFLATKDDELSGRSLILVTDASSDDGFATAASGPAADLLNRDSGIFSTANGNPVDLYAINYNQPLTDFTQLVDNTPGDGIPVITGSDTNGLYNSVRRAILSGRKLDSNPAHIIRECLIDAEWGLGVPEADIDDAIFDEVAEALFNEGFGLAFTWTQQAAVEKIIQEVCDHIQAMVYIDTETGLWSITLIRGGYDINSLVRLDPSNCKATNRQRKAVSETINEIVITYTDSDTHEETSVSFQDIANIAMQDGTVRSENRNYYAIRSNRLAQFVGGRDLRSSSYPLFSCDMAINTTVGRLRPGQVVLFSWPDDGIVDMPVRIYPVNYGKPGASVMQCSVTEDIFGLEFTSYEAAPRSLWQDPTPRPQPPEYTDIITVPLPMLLRSGVSISDVSDGDYPSVEMAALVGSTTSTIDAVALSGEVIKANGDVVVERIAELPGTRVALLEEALITEPMSTISGSKIRRLAGVSVEPELGDFMQIGEGDTTSEFVLLYSYDDGADEYTLARGMFDTTPKNWPIGTVLWFLGDSLQNLETSEHAHLAESFYVIQTVNSGGTLAISLAPTEVFTPSARPYAPHRPANARLAGLPLFTGPAYTELAGGPAIPATIPVTWANRNRLSEDVVPPLWTDPTATPESGQTTTIRICNRSTGEIVHTYAGIAEGVTSFNITPADFTSADRYIDVKIYAVRAGFESVQPVVLPLEIERSGYGRNYGFNYGAPL